VKLVVKVNCPQLSQVIEINNQESLMKNLLSHQIPVASSCGGDGICGKCRMKVISSGPLPPMSALEKKTLEKNNAETGERLSCQLHPEFNALVETTYW
jgi:ferredoxin, 2Fe-2S